MERSLSLSLALSLSPPVAQESHVCQSSPYVPGRVHRAADRLLRCLCVGEVERLLMQNECPAVILTLFCRPSPSPRHPSSPSLSSAAEAGDSALLSDRRSENGTTLK